MTNIQCLGLKANCNVVGSKLKNVEFYSSFVYNGIRYFNNEFVLMNDSSKPQSVKIAQLLSIYCSKQRKHSSSPCRGSVRWYILANDLDASMTNGFTELDHCNEVAEYISEHNVSLEDIITKCYVVLGTVEDSPLCIKEAHLDLKVTYFCRYKIYKNQLIPLLSNDQKNEKNCFPDSLLYSIMAKENCENLMVVVTSDSEVESKDVDTSCIRNKRFSKYKFKDSEVSGSECEKSNIKVKSPTNSAKLIKLSSIENVLLKSENEALDISPPPYSIIKPVNVENNDLKMKLKIIDYLRPVKVYPTKLESDIVNSNSPIKVKDVIKQNNCILLSPKAKMDIYKTPSKNVSTNRELRSSCLSVTPRQKSVPQRRSIRIGSQSKCSYADHDSSIIEEDEYLAQSVKNISLDTPSSQTNRRISKRLSCKNTTPISKTSSKTTATRNTNSQSLKDPKGSSLKQINERNDLDEQLCESPQATLRTKILSESLNSIKKKLKYDSDDSEPSTPKKCPRTSSKSPRTSSKHTPSARARLIREGAITPSVPTRNKAVSKVNTPLSKAQIQLHVSYIPKALPCRESEFENVTNFLTGKLFDGSGGCMYISGVPGTGKTATLTEVIKGLENLSKNGDIPKFTCVNINCMRLSEPRQAYVEITKQLLGKTVSWEQAQSLLEEKFVNSKAKSLPIILVVDELDILCTKRQDVVYNLLDWPTKANAQLIVVAIANTMDLPERLLIGRVTSRLGLTRLTFQAYTHKQLQEIVTKRLSGTNTFDPDAVQLVARKVASVSGDARRALDICRRAAEIAEKEGRYTLVTLNHVNQALNAMITQPKVQAIKNCCKLEKFVLQAIVSEVDRTGIEETNFQNVYQTLPTIAALEDISLPSVTVVKSVIARLSCCRLLLVDQKSCNIYQKIILNVSIDDIHYALAKQYN